MRVVRCRWFGYVRRTSIDASLRKLKITVEMSKRGLCNAELE